jgi:DNA-binding IclR family transcriptional regulator
MDDEIDPALIAILAQLWRAAQENPGRAWSLAKLSKQSGVPMSSLRRHLTALSDAALLDRTAAGERCRAGAVHAIVCAIGTRHRLIMNA